VKDTIFLGATNKVVGVIKQQLKANGAIGIEAKTLDSFFGFKMEKDYQNKTITSHSMPNMDNIPKVIVVDEISLMNDNICDMLSKLKGCRKVILMGDDMQLPPISNDEQKNGIIVNGFKKSKIFSLFDYSFTLTIQQRQQSNSDLYSLISGFRNNMHFKMPYKSIAIKKSNNTDVFFYKDDNPEFLKKLQQEDVTCVCFKNLTALSFNWLIGSEKTGTPKYLVNQLNIGDTVYFDGYYKNGEEIFYTSELVEVLDIEENCQGRFKHEDRDIPYYFKKVKVCRKGDQFKIDVHVGYGFTITNREIYSALNYDRRKIIQKGSLTIADRKKLSESYTAYNNFVVGLAKLKKPFGITSHKAQGSTFDHVVIPVFDYGNKNYQDSNQLFYVAMSRAKKSIIFVDRDFTTTYMAGRIVLSESEKNSICSTFDYKCAHCEKEVDDIRSLTIDHIENLDSGMNAISNLQPLCRDCHREKLNHQNLFSA
ncbi:MAG: hypothetical protein EOO20_12070, partial [Chryseobacterium sp.]